MGKPTKVVLQLSPNIHPKNCSGIGSKEVKSNKREDEQGNKLF